MKKVDLSSVRVFVFDLDDTLYDESLFVKGGTKAVLSYLTCRYHITTSALCKAMDSIVLAFSRNVWYQKLLEKFDILLTQELIDEMVKIYRTHSPNIQLFSDATHFIDRAKKEGNSFLGLITDGLVSVQESKVKGLNLHEQMNLIIFTWNKGIEFQKPNAWSFKSIEKESGASGIECCYFGNDPSKDFLAPNKLGWVTVCVHRNKFGSVSISNREYVAQMEISSFDEISLK